MATVQAIAVNISGCIVLTKTVFYQYTPSQHIKFPFSICVQHAKPKQRLFHHVANFVKTVIRFTQQNSLQV